jgi:hypothetical protein
MSGAFNLGGVPSAAYAYAHPWSRGQPTFLQIVTLGWSAHDFLSRRGLLTGIPWTQAALLACVVRCNLAGTLVLQRIDARQMRKAFLSSLVCPESIICFPLTPVESDQNGIRHSQDRGAPPLEVNWENPRGKAPRPLR